MVRVTWSPRALVQLRAIQQYIERFDPAAAERIGRQLFEAGQSLAEFPDRGRPAGSGARELVTVPPYVIRYTHRRSSVVIAKVKHGRQRG